MAIITFCRLHLAVCFLAITFALPCHANIAGSAVTTHAPQPVTDSTFELVLEVTGHSSDAEYIDKVTIQLPASWTVNQVIAPPANTEPTCTGIAKTGWTPANLVYWQKSTGYPSECGLWSTLSLKNVHYFRVTVTVPDCAGAPWDLAWTIYGDEWPPSVPPHSTSGTLHLGSCSAVTTAREGFNFKVVNYPGALSTLLAGINADRTIVGYSTTDLVNFHGFILADDKFTPFNVPGAVSTYPLSINNQGHIVGFYSYSVGGPPLCFHYRPDGAYSTFAPPGAVNCRATGINDNNMIVGFFGEATGKMSGFLYDGMGGYTIFSYPGSFTTMAFGINNRNQIVGRYINSETAPPREYGFRLTGTTFASFDYPGSDGTVCSKITDNGVMTGGYYVDDITVIPRRRNGLLIRGDAAYFRFSYPGAQQTSIAEMNSRRDVVGAYSLDGSTFSGLVAYDFPWELFLPAMEAGQKR